MARDRPFAIVRSVVRDRLSSNSPVIEGGQGLVEYALILSLIAIVAISILATIGLPIQTFLSSVGTSM